MNSGFYYILRDGEPVECNDSAVWGEWFEKNLDDRRVALDDTGISTVSTVFLAINHRLPGEGPPLLYETMVFGGPLDGEQWRYSTREEALKGHREVVERLLRRDG